MKDFDQNNKGFLSTQKRVVITIYKLFYNYPTEVNRRRQLLGCQGDKKTVSDVSQVQNQKSPGLPLPDGKIQTTKKEKRKIKLLPKKVPPYNKT